MSLNPIDHPDQYDAIVLADQRSPGVCKLGGPMLDHGWEKQEAKGSGGGETIQNGAKLVEFTCELYLWRDEKVDHFARWVEWRPLLRRPVQKGAAKALDIYHPQLAELGVTSVVCSKEGSLEPDGAGGAKVKLTFLQYAPAKPTAAGKPKGSTAQAGGAAAGPGKQKKEPRDPNADKKAEAQALLDEFEAT
jgi:hypothetical protein